MKPYIRIILMQLVLLMPTILNTPFSNVFVSMEIISKLYIKRIEITTKSATIIPKSNPINRLAADVNFIVSKRGIAERIG